MISCVGSREIGLAWATTRREAHVYRVGQARIECGVQYPIRVWSLFSFRESSIGYSFDDRFLDALCQIVKYPPTQPEASHFSQRDWGRRIEPNRFGIQGQPLCVYLYAYDMHFLYTLDNITKEKPLVSNPFVAVTQMLKRRRLLYIYSIWYIVGRVIGGFANDRSMFLLLGKHMHRCLLTEVPWVIVQRVLT